MQKAASFIRNNKYLLIISVCCLIETLCFTYLQEYPELGVFTATLYGISGLGVCMAALAFAVKGRTGIMQNPVVKNNHFRAIGILVSAAFLIFISILLLQFGNKMYATFPIDYHKADMLPLLRAACARWLAHQPVYTPVKEVWGGENIPYLPAMWMPFAPSLLLHIDIRWTCIALTIITVFVMLAILMRLRYTSLALLAPVLFLAIFMLVKFYTWEDSSLFELSEEAIPSFYFVLLFAALMYENDWLTGIMFALCTLSRFSLLPFLPFFFLWLVMNGGFKRALKTGIAYTTVVTAVFIIPFFMQQPGYFLGIPQRYNEHLASFWKTNNYNLVGTRDLGLAYVFGYNYCGLMGIIDMVLLIGVPVAWLVSFMRLRKRYTVQKNIWAMAGLKLTLLVFYNFINMPFLYIFEVPTLISWTLLLAVARGAEQEKLKL